MSSHLSTQLLVYARFVHRGIVWVSITIGEDEESVLQFASVLQ